MRNVFDVHNGRIYFGQYPIAKLEGAPWPGLELEAIATLECFEDQSDMVDADEHAKALQEAEKESYDSGFEEGKEAGAKECETNMREDWETQAFDNGRASALVDLDRSAQVARVDALLLAITDSHNALHTVINKRYPAAKIGECKDAMRTAMSKLKIALQTYNAPNGA